MPLKNHNPSKKSPKKSPPPPLRPPHDLSLITRSSLLDSPYLSSKFRATLKWREEEKFRRLKKENRRIGELERERERGEGGEGGKRKK